LVIEGGYVEVSTEHIASDTYSLAHSELSEKTWLMVVNGLARITRVEILEIEYDSTGVGL